MAVQMFLKSVEIVAEMVSRGCAVAAESLSQSCRWLLRGPGASLGASGRSFSTRSWGRRPPPPGGVEKEVDAWVCRLFFSFLRGVVLVRCGG